MAKEFPPKTCQNSQNCALASFCWQAAFLNAAIADAQNGMPNSAKQVAAETTCELALRAKEVAEQLP